MDTRKREEKLGEEREGNGGSSDSQEKEVGALTENLGTREREKEREEEKKREIGL